MHAVTPFLVSRLIDLLSKVDRSKADGHPNIHACSNSIPSVKRLIDLLSKVDRSKADGHPNIDACSNSIPCVKTPSLSTACTGNDGSLWKVNYGRGDGEWRLIIQLRHG
jgi:hypothetical protein